MFTDGGGGTSSSPSVGLSAGRHHRRCGELRGSCGDSEGERRLQDLRHGHPRHPVCRGPPSDRGVLHRRGLSALFEVLNLYFIWKELTLFLCKVDILGEPFGDVHLVQLRGLCAPES